MTFSSTCNFLHCRRSSQISADHFDWLNKAGNNFLFVEMSSWAEDNYTIFKQNLVLPASRGLGSCSALARELFHHLWASVVALAVRQLFPREIKVFLSFYGRCFPTIEKCVSSGNFCGTRIMAEVHHADCDSAG